jgi:hypothetical protein
MSRSYLRRFRILIAGEECVRSTLFRLRNHAAWPGASCGLTAASGCSARRCMTSAPVSESRCSQLGNPAAKLGLRLPQRPARLREAAVGDNFGEVIEIVKVLHDEVSVRSRWIRGPLRKHLIAACGLHGLLLHYVPVLGDLAVLDPAPRSSVSAPIPHSDRAPSRALPRDGHSEFVTEFERESSDQDLMTSGPSGMVGLRSS